MFFTGNPAKMLSSLAALHHYKLVVLGFTCSKTSRFVIITESILAPKDGNVAL